MAKGKRLEELINDMTSLPDTAHWSPGWTSGDPLEVLPEAPPPTLAEIGIPLKLSAESQALALLPAEKKEKVIKGETSKKKAITTATPRVPVQDEPVLSDVFSRL